MPGILVHIDGQSSPELPDSCSSSSSKTVPPHPLALWQPPGSPSLEESHGPPNGTPRRLGQPRVRLPCLKQGIEFGVGSYFWVSPPCIGSILTSSHQVAHLHASPSVLNVLTSHGAKAERPNGWEAHCQHSLLPRCCKCALQHVRDTVSHRYARTTSSMVLWSGPEWVECITSDEQ